MGIGRGRFRALLASSSVAALLIGGGAPVAFAACNTSYTNTTAAGCSNTGTITGIAINNSTITGTIANSGTISPNGIALTNGSTITATVDGIAEFRHDWRRHLDRPDQRGHLVHSDRNLDRRLRFLRRHR